MLTVLSIQTCGLLYTISMKGPSHTASLSALLPWPTSRMTTEKKRMAEIGGWKMALSFFECPWENISPFWPLVTLQTHWTLARTVASMWKQRLLPLCRSPQGDGCGAHRIWGVAADVFTAINYILGPSSWGSSPLSWWRSFSCPSPFFSLCFSPGTTQRCGCKWERDSHPHSPGGIRTCDLRETNGKRQEVRTAVCCVPRIFSIITYSVSLFGRCERDKKS